MTDFAELSAAGAELVRNAQDGDITDHLEAIACDERKLRLIAMRDRIETENRKRLLQLRLSRREALRKDGVLVLSAALLLLQLVPALSRLQSEVLVALIALMGVALSGKNLARFPRRGQHRL